MEHEELWRNTDTKQFSALQLKTQPAPRSKHTSFDYLKKQLTICTEIIAVFLRYNRNIGFLNVKTGGL
jgi:hypothetical protein